MSGYSDDVPVLSILAQLDAFRVDMVECWKPRLKRVTENNVQKDHKTCRCPGKQS